MPKNLWVSESRKDLICVDSYDNGVLKGRLFDAWQDMTVFDSLCQFLIRMEELLETRQDPQSYTEARTFSAFLEPDMAESSGPRIRRGRLATFELQILFRQHSSWQGQLLWLDTGKMQSFRSVLELVILMDSALRGM